MKYNKTLTIISIAISLSSFAFYSVFGYIECIRNVFIKDISLAIFGSALVLLASSIAGYFIEKRHQQAEILALTYDWNIGTELCEDLSNNSIPKSSVMRVLHNSYEKIVSLHNKLAQYNRGLYIKDKEIKKIAFTIREYAESLTKFELYLIKNQNYENLTKKLMTIIEVEGFINESISNWMRKKKFEMGEPFNIDISEENEDSR